MHNNEGLTDYVQEDYEELKAEIRQLQVEASRYEFQKRKQIFKPRKTQNARKK